MARAASLPPAIPPVRCCLNIRAVAFSKADSGARGLPCAVTALGSVRILQKRYWGAVPLYVPSSGSLQNLLP